MFMHKASKNECECICKNLWWRNSIEVFFIEDDELLETYKNIWNKFCNSVKTEFDCELICNKKSLKSKIRSYGHEATDFYDNEIRKVDSNCICLAVILVSCVLKKDEIYHRNCF